MTTIMRAKMQVSMVMEHKNPGGDVYQETLYMHAVCKNSYDETGNDEDNTFAKWSPGAHLEINIANPALFGKLKHGDKFYVDFTPADVKEGE